MTHALAAEMLSAFRASKLSVAEFSRQQGIPKNRVTYWRHRMVELDLASNEPNAQKAQSNFAAVVAKTMPATANATPSPLQTLEATLSSGNRIVIHGVWDASSMKNWLTAIEAKA